MFGAYRILKVFGLLLAATSAVDSAMAQDRNWTGFYAGVYAGSAWGHSNVSSASNCPGSFPRTGYYCDQSSTVLLPNAGAVGAQGTGSISSVEFTGGGLAGYNWQAGALVLGGEADFGAFNLSGSRFGSAKFPSEVFGFAFGQSVDTNWLATVRGRLGWSMSSLLLYVTGGVAFTDLHVSTAFNDAASSTNNNLAPFNATGFGSESKTKAGYVVGGGLEWALTQNWSIRGEYLYVDFGSVNTSARVSNPSPFFASLSNLITTSADLNAQIARAALSYRF